MSRREHVPVADLTAWLAGRWSVSRTVNGDDGAFTGTAAFAPDGTCLRWDETGELRLGDYHGAARRSMTIHPAAGGWEVRFDDGRPFHPLSLDDGHCDVEHLCGPDVYTGRFEVHADAAFTVRWHVVGPDRDDTILTRYARLTDAPGGAAPNAPAPPRNASR